MTLMLKSLQSPRRTSHVSVEVDGLPEFKKIRAGQPEAWEIGFKVLWGVGHSVCNSVLRNFQGVDSDLVISDAITDAISKARDSASWDELKALTARVVRCRAIDAIRRQKAHKHGGGHLRSLEDLQVEPAAPAHRRPDEDLYHAELWRAYRECTQQLTSRAQEIVELRLIDQLTQKEISEKLAIPQGTVGVTIMKTLESIRACLQARGFNPSDKNQ